MGTYQTDGVTPNNVIVHVPGRVYVQMPTEASFEKAFRAHFAPEDFSNERLYDALETLNRHGVQEGIRRLTKTDPDVANHFKTLLNSR